MRNKLEILRAIYFTEEDFKSIEGFEVEFSEKQKKFILEFKKVYELGKEQLSKFIKELSTGSKEMEPWEIEYFTTQLFNGPFNKYVAQYVGLLKPEEDQKYFEDNPDIMGTWATYNTNNKNTAAITGAWEELGVPVDIFNKCPDFIKGNIQDLSTLVNEMFRTNVQASTVNDNTLPLCDKLPELRTTTEPTGGWNLHPCGNYLVKDVHYRILTTDVKKIIFETEIKKATKDSYRIFKDRRNYNPFSAENDAYSKNFEVNTELKDVIHNINDDIEEKTEKLILDIFGNQFESDERRSGSNDVTKSKKIEFHLDKPEDARPYKLNTTKDQVEH
jgi:hypothetical protein